MVKNKKERRHAARASRQRARGRLFDAFGSHVPIGIFANDADGMCVYVNAQCCTMLGAKPAELLGDGWESRLYADDRERIAAAWRRAVEARAAFEDEYRFCRPDGKVIWVLGRAVHLPEPGYEGVRTIGTLIDVTERKVTELELQESRHRTQAVVDASPLAIVSLDAAGVVQAWSRGAERLFGWREADVLGRRCPAIPEVEFAGFLDLVDRVLAGETVQNQPCFCASAAGQQLRAALTIAPLLDGLGDKAGVVAIFDDLSAYERILGQLRELIDEHQRLVQDLHDTCIQSIFAVGLSLEESRWLVAANPAKASNAIGAAAANLNLVIQDLRAFIAPRRASDLEPRDFRAELERLVQAAGTQGPAFSIHVDEAALAALQPFQVTQLLHIAREGISNIVRHAKARNGSVGLRLTERYIRLEISDNGRGFKSRVRESMGLGLHHMRARATKLHGRWRMASSAGRGTRLYVDLQRPS